MHPTVLVLSAARVSVDNNASSSPNVSKSMIRGSVIVLKTVQTCQNPRPEGQ